MLAEGRGRADAATPVESDVPVLILSGGLDPVTPPANGAEVAKTLRDEPAHRRARLRAHRVAARVRAAAHRRVHRRSELRHASGRLASSISRRARVRRCGPTGSERALDRNRERGEGLRPAPRRACGRRRQLHRRRRRDHRLARTQRRGQDDAPAHARDADDPRQRRRDDRRPRRRARPLRGARGASACSPTRAASIRASPRARTSAITARCRGSPAPRSSARIDELIRRARHRRHRRPPRARLLAGRADEGRDRARARPRSADDPARRAHQRPRHHEHPRAARPAPRARGAGQVPALQLARDAGGLGAVPAHRHPRARQGRRRPAPPPSCSRNPASNARGCVRARCWDPAKASQREWAPVDAQPDLAAARIARASRARRSSTSSATGARCW